MNVAGRGPSAATEAIDAVRTSPAFVERFAER
jgi:hypothetical protein